MPIVKEGEGYKLKCINGHDAMFNSDSYYALRSIEPPGSGCRRVYEAPLQVVVCSVCGYTELYNDMLNNPERWEPKVSPAKVEPLPELPKKGWFW